MASVFAYAALTLFGGPSHALLLTLAPSHCSPTTPLEAVWAPPLSLAATYGISFDFSSRVT